MLVGGGDELRRGSGNKRCAFHIEWKTKTENKSTTENKLDPSAPNVMHYTLFGITRSL